MSHQNPNEIRCATKANFMRLTELDSVLYYPGSTLSQTLVGLAPGTTYALQYHYRIYFGDEGDGSDEVMTVTIGGQVVDTFSADPYTWMSSYASRSATYVATADSATLLFTLSGSYVGDFALDLITLTVACTTECG